MDNRQPTPGMEGRVLITPEDGSAPFYARMTMADNPIKEGTPFAKETVLDSTATYLLGLDDDTATPNDAFLALIIGKGSNGVIVTVKTENGFPLPNVEISGATGPDGKTAVTDYSGVAILSTTEKSLSLSFTHPYIDLDAIPSMPVTIAGVITKINITVTKKKYTDYVAVETSSDFRFSPEVSEADFCAVGGGASGGAGVGGPGSGGGSGHVVNKNNVKVTSDDLISVIVGAGGEKVSASTTTAGIDGGITSITINGDEILSANGGKKGSAVRGVTTIAGGTGGSGGGGGVMGSGGSIPTPNVDGGTDGSDGGRGAAGQGTTTRPFGDMLLSPVSGGGGGTFYFDKNTYPTSVSMATGNGGAPGGGDGGVADYGTATASGGEGYGDGGGGAMVAGSGTATSGAGHSGAALLRWR